MLNRSLMVVAASLMVTAVALAGGDPWTYEGDSGPDNWGTMNDDWSKCGEGHFQSPVDINDCIDAKLGGLQVDIKSTPLKFGLDGPTFAVEYQPGSWITNDGIRYELLQFHFHHKSEHTVDGKHYPMEAHLVLRAEYSEHANAVLGVFIEEGSENAMLNQFWNVLPRSAKNSVDGVEVNVGDLLPADKKYYNYDGSMTTPACVETVRWFVLQNPVQASKAQIDAFIKDFTGGKTNNRPIQPLYGRLILKGM